MKDLRNLTTAASFGLFQKYLPLAFAFVGLLLALPFLALGELYKSKFVQGVGFFILTIAFLSSLFTAREVAIRMQIDKSLLFSDALAHTVYRYLTFLCFVPLIGPLLQRFLERRRTPNPFGADEK